MKRHLVALLLITALVIPIPIGAQAPSQDLAIQAVVDKILQDGRNINRAALQTRSGAAAHLRRVAANVRALAAVTNFDHQAAMMGRDRLIAMGLRADVVDRLLSGGIESVASWTGSRHGSVRARAPRWHPLSGQRCSSLATHPSSVECKGSITRRSVKRLRHRSLRSRQQPQSCA